MSQQCIATIVTPVDLKYRPKDLIKKLLLLCREISNSNLKIVVVHHYRESNNDLYLSNILSSLAGKKISYIKVQESDNDINLSRLRNIGVSKVLSDIAILIDVDVYPDIKLFLNLAQDVILNKGISIAPCLYLTRLGTKLLNSGAVDFLLLKSLSFDFNYYLHWAIPSSVIAFNVKDYLKVGGFFEGYVGHGYEDFDFIVRIAIHLKLIDSSWELIKDRSYTAPLLSSGFRAALGCLCISNLIKGNIAFHQFHNKNHSSSYYKQRVNNSIIFKKRLESLLQNNINISNQLFPKDLINVFFNECHAHNVDPCKFYSLFDSRPRYMLFKKSFLNSIKNLFLKVFS